MTLIVFGPPACGKTRHAGAIARHYGLRRVVDDWDASKHHLVPGALHLTNEVVLHDQATAAIAYGSLPASVRGNPLTARDAGLDMKRAERRKQ